MIEGLRGVLMPRTTTLQMTRILLIADQLPALGTDRHISGLDEGTVYGFLHALAGNTLCNCYNGAFVKGGQVSNWNDVYCRQRDMTQEGRRMHQIKDTRG